MFFRCLVMRGFLVSHFLFVIANCSSPSLRFGRQDYSLSIGHCKLFILYPYFCFTLSTAQQHTTLIKNKALSLGFTSIGISKAEFLEEEAPKLEKWLKKGYQGEMQYLENHFDKRLDPRLLVPDAKSVVSLSYNYFPEEQQSEDSYKLAKYAYGQDYHHVIKDKLKI